jgi:hypothetical protein
MPLYKHILVFRYSKVGKSWTPNYFFLKSLQDINISGTIHQHQTTFSRKVYKT